MDIYRALGVEPIINAGGTLTRLSGSVMHPEVVDAMAAASRKFVDMPELHAAAGQRVADLIGVEAAHVCACATAGIAIMAHMPIYKVFSNKVQGFEYIPADLVNLHTVSLA